MWIIMVVSEWKCNDKRHEPLRHDFVTNVTGDYTDVLKILFLF